MRSLRKAGLSLAVALGAAASSPSHADEFQAQKPAVIDWTGFHLGAFVGGSIASAPQGYSVSSSLLASLPPIIPAIEAAGSGILRARGADVGVVGGYDWSLSKNFVIGVEGDMYWSGLAGSQTTNGIVPVFSIPFYITEKINIDWQTSLRLRAGAAPFDNLLVYVTGGPALAHINYSPSFWDADQYAPGKYETENASFHALRGGWTLGSGAEWALNSRWSLKGEYRFSQFSPVTGSGGVPLQGGSTAIIAHSTGTIRENSFRIGFGYHFN